MKRHTVLLRLLPCLAWGGAWVCLSGLTLVRLWALLYGRLPSLAIPILAVLLTGTALLVGWRLEIPRRFLLPFGPTWKTALAAVVAFVPGMALDTSYQLFSVGDMAIGGPLFRLLCGVGSGLFFACVVLALLWAGRSFGKLPMPRGTVFLAVALVVNIITALYCTGTATVYYWDTNIYWSSSTMLAGQSLGLGQLRLVVESVITQEYNYLLSFPLSLVMRVLGTNRYVFLFATVNLYVLPALLGMLVLGRRSKYGGILLCCATPMLLYTALTGFVDVAAAGAGIWAFLIYTDESRPQAARGILTGGLLTLVFLLRRYFFFFTVSFGIAAFLALLIRRSQWKSFLTMAVTGVGFSLFFGQSFVVSQVLSANYADTYSAYDQGRWIDLVMLCRYYGYVMLAVALVCVVFLLLRSKSRYGALLCLCQPVLCLFLFTRIQSHGQQHLLLYLPAFCFALAGGMELLPERRSVRWVPCALALCTLGSSFLPRPQPSHPSEIAVPDPLPAFTYVPGQRTDLAQLVALRVYVDSLSAEEQKTAAVLASSFTFNSSIYDNTLRSLNIPQSGGPATSIIYFATVDKRDGFSWNALTADYLIVADPVQTHLGADNQHILTVLAQPVLDGTGIGTAYRQLDQSFPLEDGVTVYVYERTRDITREEYQAISDTLVSLYPDYAQQYRPPAE